MSKSAIDLFDYFMDEGGNEMFPKQESKKGSYSTTLSESECLL
jgi:hypothetical protein